MGDVHKIITSKGDDACSEACIPEKSLVDGTKSACPQPNSQQKEVVSQKANTFY